jgi:hypothetical protein
MADHQATPEDKLRAIRARLNEAPRDHQRPGGYCAINISDVRWLVHFIDATLLMEDGEDAFDAFAARAAAGHLGALVDDLRASHTALMGALRPFANFACSPAGQCGCNNCKARDVLQRAQELPNV